MRNWVSARTGMPQKFIDMNLHQKDKDIRYVPRNENIKAYVAVEVDGIVFNSIKECAQYLGMSSCGLTKMLHDSMTVELRERGLKYHDPKYITTVKTHKSNGNQIIYNGKTFRSNREFADYIGLSLPVIAKLNIRVPEKLAGSNLIINGVQIDTNNNITGTLKPTASWKKVIYDNKEFVSIEEFSRTYNLNSTTVGDWLRGKYTMPTQYAEKGLRYAD